MTPPLALAILMNPAPGNAITGQIVMFGAIFAIFYFFMVAPQQKQRKQHEQRLQSLKRGDEIVTAGGIVGDVVHIAFKEPAKNGEPVRTMEDRITIKSAESRLVIERGRIARIIAKTSDQSA